MSWKRISSHQWRLTVTTLITLIANTSLMGLRNMQASWNLISSYLVKNSPYVVISKWNYTLFLKHGLKKSSRGTSVTTSMNSLSPSLRLLRIVTSSSKSNSISRKSSDSSNSTIRRQEALSANRMSKNEWPSTKRKVCQKSRMRFCSGSSAVRAHSTQQMIGCSKQLTLPPNYHS